MSSEYEVTDHDQPVSQEVLDALEEREGEWERNTGPADRGAL